MTQEKFMKHVDELNEMVETNKAKGLQPYVVSITETLNRAVIVFAPDSTDACELVQDKYWGGDEIILSSDDYVDTDFGVTPASLTDMIYRKIYTTEEED